MGSHKALSHHGICATVIRGSRKKSHRFVFCRVESKHEAEELQIGRTCYALPTAVFRLLIGKFPSAKLRSLELTVSTVTTEYDVEFQYVNCPQRRNEVPGFATLFAGAHTLEHLLLHLEPIRSFPWGILVNENGPGMSSLRADVFHSIVSKSYLDGKPIGLELDGMLLPRLKSIDLKYHQIDPKDLLKFCSERKNTLESVKLSRIVDMDPDVEHIDFIDRIRSAIGDDSSSKDIVVESSYTGGGWFDIRW